MQSLAAVLVLVWLAVLGWFDLRWRRLPNRLTLPGAALILGTAAATGHGWSALAGAGVLAGIHFIVHLLAPRGMGAGDVKLAIGLGALTGAAGIDIWFLAALLAPALTALAGLPARRRGITDLPHGTSLCLAGALAMVVQLP